MTSQHNDYQTIGTRPIRQDTLDKVTGQAAFGDDVTLPNSLVGLVLRSPHAHAIIRKIDTSKARKVKGVKAIVTARDFPELRAGGAGDIARDNLASDKVLYHGHGVAAVAATSAAAARTALKKIKVSYEPLPHVTDIDAAMHDDAPLLHDDLGYDGSDKPSNIYERIEDRFGDVEAGFSDAEVVVERHFTTPTVHQGYIEPTACLASYQANGQSTIWATTQGHFPLRDSVALMCGLKSHELKVIPTEIGGGFGGKTAPYLEAIALMLSKHSGRPVKMRMTREEVFRCAGPGAASKSRIRIGARRDGTITAMEAQIAYEAGAFPGAPLGGGMRSMFGAYDVPNIYVEGFSVVLNKPKVRAYRGPGAPQACFAVESLLNELAVELGMDPLELRLKNAVRNGTTTAAGMFRDIGFVECLEAAKQSDHYRARLPVGQGRAVVAGFWRNAGGNSSATIHMHRNGFASVMTGSADLSGTRTALGMIAAETLCIPIENVHTEVGDTESVGITGVSGGSRTVNATGQAVMQAAQEIIDQAKQRAASGWNVLPDQVQWQSGQVVNMTRDESLTLREITRQAMTTGGPLSANASVDVTGGEGPSFAVHICDVAVDTETGRSSVVRYTTIQDAGCAVHPPSVEGQYQGGASQGIGWALNEAFVYDDEGRLENAGFLDYRIPVASDLPMIETIIVEVPNSRHPFGVRGVGEAPIIPPLAAVGSAISNAIGVPMCDLPCSPPQVLAALKRADQTA
jgi:CO/xanthine dehydrogenase Mo-binding subunit